jgi:heat shock protein 5
VERLLKGLEMSIEDIDEIVLVGGSTRIPRIKQQLKSYFRKELNDHIDPDITVAYGAASILD